VSGLEVGSHQGSNWHAIKAVCGKGWSTLRTTVTREQVQQNWVTCILAVGASAILGEIADRDATRTSQEEVNQDPRNEWWTA
jgi:hypothetical protein